MDELTLNPSFRLAVSSGEKERREGKKGAAAFIPHWKTAG
jgi:hypothetical protein